MEEFTQKRKAYKAREAELKDIERQKAELERKAAERVETVLRMRDLIPVLPVWLTETDPAEVRYHLARTVSIVMNKDKTVKVELL